MQSVFTRCTCSFVHVLTPMTGNVSVTGPPLRCRRFSLLCCDEECAVEDELVVFILLAIVVKALFDDRW